MSKILNTFLLLAPLCIPLSSHAWGPYGGNPYWRGYAPVYSAPYVGRHYPVRPYVAAPYYNPAYQARNYNGYNRYPGYSSPWNYYAPRRPAWNGPWGYPGNVNSSAPNMQEMIKRSEAEREKSMRLLEARRAEFQKRMQARREAMEARRVDWQKRMNQYAPMPPVSPSLPSAMAKPKPDDTESSQAPKAATDE
ncbi:hypothetical protein TI05_11790 [Achromatium sp. WMS3]|nr:hypothetical protein TI05_11790 [Achromatium sp. WMS3]